MTDKNDYTETKNTQVSNFRSQVSKEPPVSSFRSQVSKEPPVSKESSRKDLLRKRTKEFASAVIRLYCSLPKGRTECHVIGKQFLRSGTSVAANYREASRARSDAEFIAKIELCAQEADETVLWLELLRDDCDINTNILGWLLKETDELISIFVAMSKNVKRKKTRAET